MKIAVLHPALDTDGGAEYVIYHLALGLDRAKHAVRIYTDRVGSKLGRDIDLTALHLQADGDRPAVWSRAGKYFAGELAGYDVVLCHNYPSHLWYHYAKQLNPGLPPAVLLLQEPPRHLYYELMHRDLPKKFFTRPPLRVRIGLPNLRDFVQKRSRSQRSKLAELDRAAAASAREILVTSDYVGKWIGEIYGRPAQKILLGTRYELREPMPGERNRYILCVSRLELLKNLETLLRAFTTVVQQVPGINLVLVGQGDDARRLTWLRNSLGLQKRVYFRGWVSPDELVWLYRRALLFAFIPLAEPFGLVNLEALSCGVPVVTSDHGGPSEVLDDTAGRRVPPLDAARVASTLVELLNDHDVRERLSAGAIAKAKEWRFARTVTDVAAILAAAAAAPR